MSEPTPRISATALANLFRDHRASNEWNAAVVFYLSGYDDLAARVAELEKALCKYGRHPHRCVMTHSEGPCTCGLYDLLKGLSLADGEKP